MAAPELKNYIEEQKKLGVSDEAIRNALHEAGWQDSEIDEAIGEAAAARGKPASPAVQLISPSVRQQPLQQSVQTAVQQKIQPVFITRDIFQPKDEPGLKQEKSFFEKDSPVLKTEPQISRKSVDYKKFVLPGVSVLAIAALATLFAFLYKQTKDLNGKLSSQNSDLNSLNQKLNSLGLEKDNLTGQVASLNQATGALKDELSLFVVPAGVSSAQELTIVIKGVLSLEKGVYKLTAPDGVAVFLKSSPDKTDVFENLKKNVGGTIEVTGTHLPGSNSVKVSEFNPAS